MHLDLGCFWKQPKKKWYICRSINYWLEHWMRVHYEDLYYKNFFSLHVGRHWVFSSNILQYVYNVLIAEIS